MSRYIVAQTGYLEIGERMNVAVLAWEGDEDHARVLLSTLDNWHRVQTAFPRLLSGGVVGPDIHGRLSAIRTLGDLRRVETRTGPYTPFIFSEPRASLDAAATLLEWASKRFLVTP